METIAYVYKWTHVPTLRWYVGSRTRVASHPGDGYICSKYSLRDTIVSSPSEWKREVIATGTPEEMSEFESMILQLFDAAGDSRSYNEHNNNGLFRARPGSINPMKNPLVAEARHRQSRGEKHWTKKLGDKPHPQLGQSRPTIAGDNHPNKNPVNANKIRLAHLGKKHDYMVGDDNVMRRPDVILKHSGDNHWTAKIENQRTCQHCGISGITKTNFTRWHGNNCKRNNNGQTV